MRLIVWKIRSVASLCEYFNPNMVNLARNTEELWNFNFQLGDAIKQELEKKIAERARQSQIRKSDFFFFFFVRWGADRFLSFFYSIQD